MSWLSEVVGRTGIGGRSEGDRTQTCRLGGLRLLALDEEEEEDVMKVMIGKMKLVAFLRRRNLRRCWNGETKEKDLSRVTTD